MKNDTATRQRIAQTILAQLGGRQFIMLTGARLMVAQESGLSFRIGRGAKKGINHVEVTLTPDDLYTLTFRKIRGLDVKVVREIAGFYADQLRDLFEDATGFFVTLHARA